MLREELSRSLLLSATLHMQLLYFHAAILLGSFPLDQCDSLLSLQ